MKVNKQFVYEEVQPQGRGVSAGTFLVMIVLMLVAGFYGGFKYSESVRYGTASPDRLSYDELDVIYNQVKSQYDGEVDATRLLEGAKKGLVAGLDDPYSVYFTAGEAEEFLGDLEGDFEGIGAELDQRDGQLTIVSVLDGSPALKSGLTAGDIIAEVDGEEEEDLTCFHYD